METKMTVNKSPCGTNLETFLRGMETLFAQFRKACAGEPLKPSLEGWKPGGRAVKRSHGRALETFLRGMETQNRAGGIEMTTWDLETFLRGMETSPKLLQPTMFPFSLETFLRGMETPLCPSVPPPLSTP